MLCHAMLCQNDVRLSSHDSVFTTYCIVCIYMYIVYVCMQGVKTSEVYTWYTVFFAKC